MNAVEMATDMSCWPAGCRHYRLGDGSYVVIEVDQSEPRYDTHVHQITQGAGYTYRQRPTVVVAVDENGCATSLDRMYEFAPGTSHDEVIAQLSKGD
ncbi:Uncharacterised protein [Mycobacteroides abscessus subsp. massiliense]|nr:Uncharacterised protein [Mycobacteroides abscessus subsp. massiliense]